MNSKDKTIHSYIKKIKHHLPICKSRERAFLNDMFTSIKDYSDNIPELTEQEIISEFGDPKNLAANYIIEADASYLNQEINYSRKIKKLAVIFIIIVLSIYSITVYKMYKKAQSSYINREIVTIEEDNHDN
ncbi:MAG: hypothetical protein K5656_07835 [Lachnospiraceae bacterium]|nr:hypothetical protein [Lachnospiraceae bacterium]